MASMKNWIAGTRLAIGMLVVQAIAAAMQLLSRAILGQGMFIFALMVYRNIVGTITVAPLVHFRHRRTEIRFCWSAFFWLFMVALTGITMAMGFFYYGLRDTTATYATNFLNLIPIVTFLLSLIFRLEKLRPRTKAGKIKVCGACVCLAGALTTVVYKGKRFQFSDHSSESEHHRIIANNINPNWGRGTIFLLCSCVSYALWFIIQAKLAQVFPQRFLATMLTCIIASVQSSVVGVCIDRNKSSWRLGWNLQLVTIFYSGILGTAATYCLISWGVAKRGPTYPSMFNPLSLIFVAILEVIFLGEEFSVGSLLGMGLMIVGLYSFLWGKNMELTNHRNDAHTTTAHNQPAATVFQESSELQLKSVVVPDDDSHTQPNKQSKKTLQNT